MTEHEIVQQAWQERDFAIEKWDTTNLELQVLSVGRSQTCPPKQFYKNEEKKLEKIMMQLKPFTFVTNVYGDLMLLSN